MNASQWLAIAALTLAAPATAVTHTVNLTVDLATATSNTFSFDGNTLTQVSLTLTGFTPFTVTAGDVIEYSVAFTGFMFGVPPIDYFAIPSATAGPFGQLFAINFFRIDGTDPLNASNEGIATLSGTVGDLTGVNLNGGCSNCLSPIMGRAPGPFDAFGFQGITGMTTLALDGSYEIDSINFGYQVQVGFQSAVPEPATWAMLLGGFGVVGLSMRRRPLSVAA